VRHFHYDPNADDSDPTKRMLGSAVYLQVSTISQALIFVTRSRGWSYTERPGLLLVTAFIIAQAVHAFLNLPELLIQTSNHLNLLISFCYNFDRLQLLYLPLSLGVLLGSKVSVGAGLEPFGYTIL